LALARRFQALKVALRLLAQASGKSISALSCPAKTGMLSASTDGPSTMLCQVSDAL